MSVCDCELGPSIAEFRANQGIAEAEPMHFIYGLYDPPTGDLRYIGKADNPDYRLVGHLREDRGTHRCNWVQQLRRGGLKPVMVIIDAAAYGSDWAQLEKIYIAAARRGGERLTNATDGGEGVSGLPPETRERLSAAQRGKKHSAETRARMSAAHKGRPLTAECRENMRKVALGRKISPAAREKMRASHLKLTIDQVVEIRRLLAEGISQSRIAPRYGVSNGTISNINIGRTYRGIGEI